MECTPRALVALKEVRPDLLTLGCLKDLVSGLWPVCNFYLVVRTAGCFQDPGRSIFWGNNLRRLRSQPLGQCLDAWRALFTEDVHWDRVYWSPCAHT